MSNTTTPPAPSSQVVDKANWDSAQTKIFVDLCVQQVNEGRRPGSHFTKYGWQRIVAGFTEKTGKRYDQPQLKNKWDNLKKDYKLFQKLRLHDTGTGWDNVRNTILADNDWWEKRLKENKKVAKFRIQGPENLDQLEILFDGLCATGEFAFIPGSSIPNDEQPRTSTGENVEFADIGFEESTDPEFDINNEEGNEVSSAPTPAHRQVRRRSVTPGTRGKKKRKATVYREEISKSLVSAMNSRTHAMTSNPPPATATTPLSERKAEIADCMRILEEIPETAEIGDLLMFSLKLFQKKHEREFFTAMIRRDWQLAWLKMKYSEAMSPSAGGTQW